jgi:acyl-homoserine lactone acylase PvdQ
LRRFIAAAVAATSFAVLLTPAASAADYASTAMDIVPSGEYGSLSPPAGADTQALMYDALTPLFNHVTDSQLRQFFKPEPLGSAYSGLLSTETVPQAGVTIARDSYDVPHITGVTRDDVTWGAGWVTAEDRGLLLSQARYDSLVAAIDAPGLAAFDLVTSLQSFKPSAQTIAEVSKQTAVLLAAGARGRDVLNDIDVYLRGINAYLASQHSTEAPFTRVDIYAFNALKDQFLGEGGGQEAVRSQFLSSLQGRLGAQRGLAVFNDLRELSDPESPSSLPGHTSLLPPPRNTSGNVILDPGSLSGAATRSPDQGSAGSVQASNAFLVSGSRSATGHPLMVAGPQIGYSYPGLTLEMELSGPGISERGITSAPFPGYILIGRNQDSGWSLTSAGFDLVDTYVETLCGGSRVRYLFDGKCRAMQLFDAGSLGGKKITFYRTVHGSVIGYARVHGRLVALSRKRSSYGKDVLDLLFYHDLSDGLVHNVRQFFRAASLTPQTFNSLYIDDKDIGLFTSGLIPIRPATVDPGLPIDGRGKEEWRGYVSFKDHPQGINPPSGEIVNWNNRPQAGYLAPDDNWSLGAVHRVDLLLKNLGAGTHLTPGSLVAAMNEAATQDVREITFEPVLSKLLRTGPAPSARDTRMLAILDAWRSHGGSRLDRTGNGQITDPGAAIMDTAWPLLAGAWASSVLSTSLQAQLSNFMPQFDYPYSGPLQPGGREQTKGWFVYMDKDLRTILGERVKGKFAVRYCGAGSLARCRALLWAAIHKAGNQLTASQGADPLAWRSDANRERISFVPTILHVLPSIRYTNRPTGIQQVLSFAGHAPQDTGR